MFLVYVLDGTLVLIDMWNGLIEPIHPKNTSIQWFWPKSKLRKENNSSNTANLSDSVEKENYNKVKMYDLHWWFRPAELLIKPESLLERSLRSKIYISCVRSVPWILAGFFITWPVFVGVSYAIWGNDNYNSYPQPQWMSATYGGIMMLLTNPWMALMTMIYMGERVCREKDEAIRASDHSPRVDTHTAGIDGENRLSDRGLVAAAAMTQGIHRGNSSPCPPYNNNADSTSNSTSQQSPNHNIQVDEIFASNATASVASPTSGIDPRENNNNNNNNTNASTNSSRVYNSWSWVSNPFPKSTSATTIDDPSSSTASAAGVTTAPVLRGLTSSAITSTDGYAEPEV